MKNTKLILIAAAAVALLASTSQSQAQHNTVGDDGIAASPKLRQFMNERGKPMVKGAKSATVASVGYRATGVDGITASPKLRQFINQPWCGEHARNSSRQGRLSRDRR